MKRSVFIVTLAISVILLSAGEVEAHPGRTDSSGGHTCRTNCPSWGLEYGEYHYHNGGYTYPTPYTTPYSSPYSTPYVTPVIASPKPTPSPTPTPEVKGEVTVASPSPNTIAVGGNQTSTGDTILGFGLFAAMLGGAIWGIRSLVRKFRSQPPTQNE